MSDMEQVYQYWGLNRMFLSLGRLFLLPIDSTFPRLMVTQTNVIKRLSFKLEFYVPSDTQF